MHSHVIIEESYKSSGQTRPKNNFSSSSFLVLSLPKPLKTLLLHLILAVIDLGVALLVQFLYIVYFVVYLIVVILFIYLFISVSLFGLVPLSADRFLAIHLHLRYKELVTHKRVVAVVIIIWVFSAFLSLIRRLSQTNTDYMVFIIIEVT